MATKTTNYNLTKPEAGDFYNIDHHNGNMDIIDAELKNLDKNKAPSGHGLGTYAPGITSGTMLEALARGCGFYQIQNAADTPSTSPSWISLLQSSRGTVDGKSTGFQVAAYDYYKNKPQMWFRTVISDEASEWNELLHTGNLLRLMIPRIETKTYVGSIQDTTDVEFSFKPQLIILGGMAGVAQGNNSRYTTMVVPYGMPEISQVIYDSANAYHFSTATLKFVYNENKVTIQHNGFFNIKDSTYRVVGVG